MNSQLHHTISDVQNLCKVISKLKSQLIPAQPHYSHNALFLKNDDITTGLLNNTTEIKIHLVTGQLLYTQNEQGDFIDLIASENLFENLKEIVTKYGLEMPPIAGKLRNLNDKDLLYYLAFASKVSRSLEIFRMKLRGNFTQVHLWPDGFDFSVEWFTMKNDEQIGIGISPGEGQDELPYLYVNPYPFREDMVEQTLPTGVWQTAGSWSGIKVEWEALENSIEKEIANKIYELFLIAQRNFQ